jgi:hypothetical protein
MDLKEKREKVIVEHQALNQRAAALREELNAIVGRQRELEGQLALITEIEKEG